MIYLRLFSQDKINWIISAFVFLWMIFMLVLNKNMRYKRKERAIKVWKLLCEIPLCICIIHFIFFCVKSDLMLTIMTYGGFYITAIVTGMLPLLFKMKKTLMVTIISVFIAAAGVLTTEIYTIAADCGIRNYSHKNYIDSFEEMTENMKKYYTLTEWKNIDIDKLKDEIMPLVKEAQKENNPALYYAAMCRYTYNFYDGHTWVKPADNKIQQKAEEMLAGNDYGFSMIKLSNGETVATLVEDGCAAEENGLENGCRILKWDGVDIDEAIDNVECVYSKEYGRWPVKNNEDMFRPIFLAGRGADEIEVTYIASDNKEKTVKLSKMGSYRNRLEKACEIILSKDKLKEQKNFDTYMINDTFGYLRISEEEYSFFSDMSGYISGSNPFVRKMFDEKIGELKKQGMKKLIIDVRNNTGGYSVIPLELTSLFTKEDIFINSFAYIDSDKKQIIRDEYVKADGKYADLDVIVLTNCRCVSSGDYLVYCMSKCKNVKIAGMTTSTGSSQPIGGNCVLADGICQVKYPQNWMLDENGDRFIDTKEDRESRIALDDVIPLTYEGAEDMYYNNTDYELKYITEKY